MIKDCFCEVIVRKKVVVPTWHLWPGLCEVAEAGLAGGTPHADLDLDLGCNRGHQ